ncbi:N-acetyltransferase [Sinorhizobium sp. BG8]|uniref:GNAT family N-acetyltransferase n=1 Tax=Sinorhizobium sp. BG8 TaxID=2613773 RepID=UPI00193EC1D0|nr:N-acetyltransferase [Sinorhizobium sp. BG8]QRM55524.1 N-acetyltransferase [Sinorhizobium sp. BG8]
MIIRTERPADIAPIHALTAAAFAGHPYSSGTEPFIIDRLREADALTLSLVAEIDGEIVGHVAFSPVAIDGKHRGWYGLGPLSVAPARQRQGIGSALVEEGLSRLRADGAEGCVLAGNPAYYERFGFANDPAFTYPGVPPQYFMRVAFSPIYEGGEVSYHPGFDG